MEHHLHFPEVDKWNQSGIWCVQGEGQKNQPTNGLLSLVRDVKGNNNFYRKNGSLLLNGARDLVTQGMEKAMAWNAFDYQ